MVIVQHIIMVTRAITFLRPDHQNGGAVRTAIFITVIDAYPQRLKIKKTVKKPVIVDVLTSLFLLLPFCIHSLTYRWLLEQLLFDNYVKI